MPHVVLNGNVDMESLLSRFEPVMINDSGTILKTLDMFINKARTIILLDSRVIEHGEKKAFLAAISKRDDGAVVRIYPVHEVERTKGVFKLIAEIGKRILSLVPDLTVGKTNLQDYL